MLLVILRDELLQLCIPRRQYGIGQLTEVVLRKGPAVLPHRRLQQRIERAVKNGIAVRVGLQHGEVGLCYLEILAGQCAVRIYRQAINQLATYIIDDRLVTISQQARSSHRHALTRISPPVKSCYAAPMPQPDFLHKPLDQMTPEEWESLCDGCGLCCQIRVEDEDSGEIALSNVACQYLCLNAHRCTDYANRQQNVPDCIKVTPDNVLSLDWLPHTCGYRLAAFGQPLPKWHPLVCGDPSACTRTAPA